MFLYSAWRSTSINTRVQIAEKFGIIKVGPTHVRDNYVESDGYKIEDVEKALNIDAIQEFLGVEQTDMVTLFELLVAKIENRTIEVMPETITQSSPTEKIVTIPIAPPGTVLVAKKRGRKPKAK